ncbi:MAG: phosphoglucomutase/phosphomannomutase family protein [Candidatus Ozemobacteraceae bacterium]
MEIKFGTSGWRDLIADGFTFHTVRICTQAIADHLLAGKAEKGGVIIGSDTRFLSPQFMAIAARVLAANGIKVFLCVRDTPTPVISFEILRRKASGAINFTASHNPPEYHGLKFSPAWGGPALPVTTGDIEQRANALMKSGKYLNMEMADAEKQGLIERINPMDTYLEDLRKKVDLKIIGASGLKILVNPLYGTSRGYLDRILREAGCSVDVMNDHLDPYFGNLPPEPSEHEIPDMIQRMKTGGYDLGLATDGDADRFGVLGKDGRFYEPNQILGMVLDHLKSTRNWTGGVARSVATTHLVDAVAAHHKIEVFETPVGFKYVGELISQDKIVMGGEESAGMTIKGHVPEKDGIIACLVVAEMVAKQKLPIADILENLYKKVGTYLTRRLNFRLTQAEKDKVIEKLKTDPKEVAGFKVKKVVKIDGTKYLLDNDAWVLMRLSGTEPVVRYYAEARDQKTLDALSEFGRVFMKG